MAVALAAQPKISTGSESGDVESPFSATIKLQPFSSSRPVIELSPNQPSYRVKFENPTSKPVSVEIKALPTSKGISGSMSSTKIAPGDHGELVLQWDCGSYPSFREKVTLTKDGRQMIELFLLHTVRSFWEL